MVASPFVMPEDAMATFPEALSADRILSAIEQRSSASANPVAPDITVLSRVDSTNALALKSASSGQSGAIWVAEQQTAGRGRSGRRWHSPDAASVYFSMLWHFDSEVTQLEGLSLAVGVVVAELLDEMGVADVQLKWPNDVLCNGQKLGGILLEMQLRDDGCASVVVGVGLNVSLPIQASDEIDQAWTDLSQQLDEAPSRNDIIAALAVKLWKLCEEFPQQGFAPLKPRWARFDCLANQPVDTYSVNGTLSGLVIGVADSGALMLSVDGETQMLHGGEISVRARGAQ